MKWMIRNDGKSFETKGRISIDPGLDEEMHLSGEYEDEAKKIKKILKVQMNQEFVYAVKDCCPSSARH